MSNKNPKYNKPVSKPLQKGKPPVAKAKIVLPEYPPWLNYGLLASVVLATFWCYHYTLHNQFTNWDDGLYIMENPYIKNLSGNIGKILFTPCGIAYYHPLAMLSLALNYHYTGASPEPFYLTNIIIHILDSIMIYFLSMAMFKAMVKKGYGQIKGIPYWAALCALWHGIHPMHVESISWIAERKDSLYVFFYLIGMYMYLKYIMEGKIKDFIWVAVFFIISLLSKPMAVVFPLSLLAMDVLFKRDKQFKLPGENKIKNLIFLAWNLMLNKIPFFFISLVYGYVTYQLSKDSGSISKFAVFSYIQRFTFVGVNYLMYLAKYFGPFHLCSFYPYPEFNDAHELPFYYYFGLPAAIIITVGLLYLAYKNGENIFRVALFGFLYYLFNVMFILQFVSAGPAIMADRYSYASYIGFTFMLVYLIHLFWDKMPSLKVVVIILLVGFSGMLAYVCQDRTLVWHNTKTLWQDVIVKYPATLDTVYDPVKKQYVIHTHEGVETAYKNLGNYYVQDLNPPNYDSAYDSYVVLEKIASKDAGVYANLGNIWAIRGNIKKSLEEYTKSLNIDSNNFDTYLNRAITYSKMGKDSLAIIDFNHAHKIDSNNESLYQNRGYTLLNGTRNYRAALSDYNHLIQIEPNNAEFYKSRGLAELNLGMNNDAIKDFNKMLGANPKDKETLYFMCLTYKGLKSYPQALDYAKKAQEAGYKVPDGTVEELQKLARSSQ